MNAAEAIAQIAVEASKGELVFPTNLNATLKITQTLDSPDCDSQRISQLVQAEPLLSAKVVGLANSVTYNRSGRQITDVQAAISLVGFRSLRALAMAESVRQFGCMILNPVFRARSAQLWEHTAHVAALAHLIARRALPQEADAAMFAAIVHEVGGFYLLSRAHAYPALVDWDAHAWLAEGEVVVSRAVLKRLDVPEPVIDSVAAVWRGCPVLPPGSMGDILCLADRLVSVCSPLREPSICKPHEQETVNDLLNCEIKSRSGSQTLGDLLAESEEEVKALIALLL